MIWGYAGVFPGEFRVWDGDTVMNQLQFMVDHGFSSTHLSLKEMRDPARRDQIGAFVAEHDLRISVGFHAAVFDPDIDVPRRAADTFLAELEEHADVLRVPIVTTGVGPFHRFMREPSLQWQMDRLSEVYAPLVEGCGRLGLRFGIENHGDYYCDDLVDLCRRTPGLGIFLDTGNTYLIGEQSVRACRAAAPYTIGTHFKDHFVHPDPKTLTFIVEGAPLGEGDVGLREVYAALLESAPDPDRLVMQWEMVPPKDMDAFECLERSWTFVRSLQEDES